MHLRLAWSTKFQNSQGYTDKCRLENLERKRKKKNHLPLSCASVFLYKTGITKHLPFKVMGPLD